MPENTPEKAFGKSPEEIYWQYCQKYCSTKLLDLPEPIKAAIRTTNWDEPQSALDFNNIAVLALVEVENTEDTSEKLLYWEFALESLQCGLELPESFLCKAHLAIIYSLINDTQTALNLAHQYFIEILQLDSMTTTSLPLGLVYMPSHLKRWSIIVEERLVSLLHAQTRTEQAYGLLVETLCHSIPYFYNANGLRFLQIATQFNQDSALLNLQLGIAGLLNHQLEGLAYLHRARKIKPNSSAIIQVLYLAYRDLQKFDNAAEWRQIAATYSQQIPNAIDWQWANLDIHSSFTYIPFGNNFLLAVEASLKSIVTSVLLAQGDWFESEMALWRDQIKPGMTVIDVGANVGVYTYSAAQLVGESGQIIAIEPFSGCIKHLQETARINQLKSVKILTGAASDHEGTARLSLNSASELNELIPEDVALKSQQNFEIVPCFTLDSLIETEQIHRVDWLKIDAESHELQVLWGARRMLESFYPNIIYENIAGAQGNNTQVAHYLTENGYLLFRYTPYLKQMNSINSLDELNGNLNIIAIHNSRIKLEDSTG